MCVRVCSLLDGYIVPTCIGLEFKLFKTECAFDALLFWHCGAGLQIHVKLYVTNSAVVEYQLTTTSVYMHKLTHSHKNNKKINIVIKI